MDDPRAPEEAGHDAPAGAEKESAVFPIVGVGASAGGLAAFEAFFSGVPAGSAPGMAFVLVQHLAPDHKSLLTDLLTRSTSMEVHEVEDGVVVRPNCVYIIPPNRDMALLKGALHLLEPSAPRGQRLPIDYFFRSLAQDQRDRAICVVLSGTGSDGSMGARAIKGEGGMVMVQDPDSAEYDGMPRSAIGTGLADFVLRPPEMPAQLMDFASRAYGRRLGPQAVSTPQVDQALKKICVLLRAQTGHDFSEYKPSTVQRRIARRMAVHQLESLEAYTSFLAATPAELEALFRDLLIGVTSFFRDPDAFQVLEEQVIPKLLSARPPGSTLRVWSLGCSSGEEAYSIAMLLQERVQALKQNFKVQVFATDIDRQAIALARAGSYPASIAAEVSAERLARFFVAEPAGGGFRIHKTIRDLVLFSEQDAIRDPPFSRLDLVSCRNVLIYMSGELQKRLIPLFHYALNPDGFLFLGNSETVGDFAESFSAIDRKAKVYQRRGDFQVGPRVAPRLFGLPTVARDTQTPLTPAAGSTERRSLKDVTEQTLLRQLAPPAALVNARGDILYLHGRVGAYLEPPPGEVGVSNVLKMAREGLAHELTVALHKAVSTRELVWARGQRVKTNGDTTTVVDVAVRPVAPSEAPGAAREVELFLVVFEEAAAADPQAVGSGEAAPSPGPSPDGALEADARVEALAQALRAKEEYLQAANEELETSNEELKSSNEEMQSVNEELQSTNEELETSKEELQSVNEELATVNVELQTKVADLSRVNNDMNNLLAGTGIGTVFVDQQLRIVRFTPTATKIINLIQADVGRPVGHIVSNLVGYDRLIADTQEVLDRLIPKEVEVRTLAGAWHTMRILPYRTLDNVIEGAVITFVDITGERRTQAALAESDARFQHLVATLPEQVWSFLPDGRCDSVSPAWLELTGVPEARQLGRGWLEQVHPDERSAVWTSWRAALESGSPARLELHARDRAGTYRCLELRARPVRQGDGPIERWLAVTLEGCDRTPPQTR
jgi:two-component system CheB/CheR fusion protein